MHLLGTIAGLTFIALAWLVPNHYPPWTSAWNDGAAGVGVLILGSLVWFPRFKTSTTLTLCFPVATGISLLALALQTLLGTLIFQGDGYVVALYASLFLVAIWIGATLRQSPGALVPLHWLPQSWLVSALLSVGVALCQWTGAVSLGIFGLELHATGARAVGNLAQPSQFATVCFMGLASALWLHTQARLGRVVLWLCAVTLMSGMLMAQSRVASMQMVVWTALGIWLAHRGGASSLRNTIFGLGLLYACASIVWPDVVRIIGLDLPRSSQSALLSGSMRLRIWALLTDAIVHTPLLGYGWLQVGWVQQLYSLQHPAAGDLFEHGHNIVLDLLTWNGVILGGATVTLVAWWFWRVTKERCDVINLGPLLLLAGVGAHAMVELPLEYAYILIPSGLCVGFLDATPRLKLPNLTIHPAISASVLAAGGIMFSVIAWDYVAAETSFRTLRMEAARIGTDSIRMEPPHLLVLDQLEAYMRFVATEASPGMTASQLEEMRKVAHRYGYAPVLFRYALASGLNGQPTEAQLTLQRLCQIHTPRRCHEAVEGWAALQTQYPELRGVKFTPHSP